MERYTFIDSINALEERVGILEAELQALKTSAASLDQEEEEITEEDPEE